MCADTDRVREKGKGKGKGRENHGYGTLSSCESNRSDGARGLDGPSGRLLGRVGAHGANAAKLCGDLEGGRALQRDRDLLALVGHPRARRPRSKLVLRGVELVVDVISRHLQEVNRLRREAAERLEDERDDLVLLGDGLGILPNYLPVPHPRI